MTQCWGPESHDLAMAPTDAKDPYAKILTQDPYATTHTKDTYTKLPMHSVVDTSIVSRSSTKNRLIS